MTSSVIMSSLGFLRRASATLRPNSNISCATGLENGNSLWASSTGSGVLGVLVAEDAVAHLYDVAALLLRHAQDLGKDLHGDLGRYLLNESNSPLGSVSVRTLSQTVRTASSHTITAREVKRRAISFLSSVWRGGLISSWTCGLRIWSGSRSSSEVPPTSEVVRNEVAVYGRGCLSSASRRRNLGRLARGRSGPGPRGSACGTIVGIRSTKASWLERSISSSGTVDVGHRRPPREVMQVLSISKSETHARWRSTSKRFMVQERVDDLRSDRLAQAFVRPLSRIEKRRPRKRAGPAGVLLGQGVSASLPTGRPERQLSLRTPCSPCEKGRGCAR